MSLRRLRPGMSNDNPLPLVRRGEAVEYESVDAAEGLRRGVLLDETDGTPTFAIRRFTLAPGAEVPKHTNEVEHEQYVLAGEYVVGIGEDGDGTGGEAARVDGATLEPGAEHRVSAGDALFIPAGTVHWYRNDGDTEGAFLCAVPNGDDTIELAED